MKRWIRSLTLGLLGAAATASTWAQDKVTFMSSWYAQAEHGGFYQAVAKGIYKKHGLDVTIKMGGPQVNNMQLMLAGQADFIMSYDLAVLSAVKEFGHVSSCSHCSPPRVCTPHPVDGRRCARL